LKRISGAGLVFSAGANRADITKVVANLQQQSTEAAVEFILSVTRSDQRGPTEITSELKQHGAGLWSYAALGDEWVKANRAFDHIAALINMGKITTMEALHKET
jgi:hypothetical protein